MRRSLALAVLLIPARAEAHLVTTGLGPIYDGVSHLLLSPEDLVPVLALSLLAGLQGPTAGRWALFTLPTAWLLGGLAGFLAAVSGVPDVAAVASFLGLGLLLAADLRLSPPLMAGIAAAVGLLQGWLNGVGIAGSGREALGLVGIVGATFVVAALVSAFAVTQRAGWVRVALRVAGSWVAAVGLLMLGWAFRQT